KRGREIGPDGEEASPGIAVAGRRGKQWDSRSKLGVFALGRSCVPPLPLLPFWLDPYGVAQRRLCVVSLMPRFPSGSACGGVASIAVGVAQRCATKFGNWSRCSAPELAARCAELFAPL